MHPQKTLFDQIHQENMKPSLEKLLSLYHKHQISSNQCGSNLVHIIDAPLSLVWSVVRRFDKPESYKQFIKSCNMRCGDGGEVGSVREVMLASGLPGTSSLERLERLDDEMHVMEIGIIGGDHRLVNYQSTISLHDYDDSNYQSGLYRGKTLAIESYKVDVPDGNTEEETCLFVNTIIGCNLRSLADKSEKLALSL